MPDARCRSGAFTATRSAAIFPLMTSQSAVNDTAWTLGRLLNWTADYFARHELDEPRLSAEVLLAHAVQCNRISLYTRFGEVLDAERLAAFRLLVQRAVQQEPIAYLVGEREFLSLPFGVTRAVLIPRPETETLVECVIEHCRRRDGDALRIFELGVGSGCVSIALLVNLPKATVVATDISRDAIEVARTNAQRHKVEERLSLVECDGLAIPAELLPEAGFDVIVSNPPYVTAGEMDTLDRTVREYEPRAALCDEEDGMRFYRLLRDGAESMLAMNGIVAVEVGDGRADAVHETMTASGMLAHSSTHCDRVTGRERVLVFMRAQR